LTAGKRPSGLPPELAAEISKVWSDLQKELAAFSTNSEHRVIDDAGHYIQYDNPDAVIAAIRDVSASIESSAADDQQ